MLGSLNGIIAEHKRAMSVESENNMQETIIKNIWVSTTDGKSWQLAELDPKSPPLAPGGATISVLNPSRSGAAAAETAEESSGLATLDIPLSQTHPFDPSHAEDFDDASFINNLHEAPLLYLLLKRFSRGDIYTYCSDVLISVNPYKLIHGMYSEEKLRSVFDASSSVGAPGSGLSPHVYNVADKAYHVMMKGVPGRASRKNQSVIISGESGAGKTEAAKQVMKYLIAASRLTCGGSSDGTDVSIQASLLQSNVILEAFGNAKTLRNDNSSRFGKYIKLCYDDTHALRNAYTEHFLLEKTRVLQADSGERNYHVFYQLLAGLDDETKAELHLTTASDYKMLNCGGTLSVDGVDDGAEFAALKTSLSTIGLTEVETSELFKLLAALLHLGNMEFVGGGEDGARATIETPSITMDDLAALLGVERCNLENAVTIRNVRSGRGSLMSMMLSFEQARQGVMALTKHMYGELFAWLVDKINVSNASDDDDSSNNSDGRPSSDGKANAFIGILDIFGFEIMKLNSLSQLCINFANEKLQQQFNHQIFTLEKVLYSEEEIPASFITFHDNQPVIDLLEKKPVGIIRLLEEQSLLSRKPNTAQLVSSFDRLHEGKHPNYQKARFGNDTFLVKHFAGDVLYTADDLIAKNNDSLHDDLKILLGSSTNGFVVNTCTSHKQSGQPGYVVSVRDITEGDPESGGGVIGKAKLAATNTVTSVFRTQLQNLVATLTSTEPHYIKCIKPNSSKSPVNANDALVLEQLRYSGVLEVVRIRREGFPIRFTFSDFHRRYEVLCHDHREFPPSRSATSEESSKVVDFICSRCLEPEDFECGKTMIFMRNGIQEKLDAFIQKIYRSMAIKIQARHRTHAAVRTLGAQRISAMRLQALSRMAMCAKKYGKQKETAVFIQAFARCQSNRRNFARQKESASKIASRVRAHQCSESYRQLRATIMVQAYARKWKAKKQLAKVQKAQTVLSANARARQAKKQFNEAKDSAVLLQSLERQRIVQSEFSKKKETAVAFQSMYRMHHEKEDFAAKKAAAIKIEAAQRKAKDLQDFNEKKSAALALHTIVRRFLAVAKLEHKKMGLFSGKKRRNDSVLYQPKGDYSNARGNAELIALIKHFNDNEDEVPNIVFADQVNKFNRRGKQQIRQFLLTNGHCYIIDGAKIKGCHSLSEPSITSASLSTMADDFVILHVKGDRDLIFTCQHKTELVESMRDIAQQSESSADFKINCADELAFQTYGSGFSRSSNLVDVTLKFVEDASLPEELKWKLSCGKDGFSVAVAPALATDAKQQLSVPRIAKFKIMEPHPCNKNGKEKN